MKPVLQVVHDRDHPRELGGQDIDHGGRPMADAAEKGTETWVKWVMGIAATVVAAVSIAMGTWLFNTTASNNTSITAMTVSTSNTEKAVTEIKENQDKTIELLQGVATKREVGDLKIELQTEVAKLKDRLAIVERELALIEDRGKR